MKKAAVKIRVGQMGGEFLKNNDFSESEVVNKQPAGLNFYKYRWALQSPGTVVIEHGQHSVSIEHVLSIMGTEDAENLDRGIFDYHVGAGVTSADLISHDEARQKFMVIIEKLKSAGWVHVIDRYDPRLSGEWAFKYALEDSSYSFPLNYVPDLNEWMKIQDGTWRMHANGVFMDISMRRDSERMDIDALGAYFLSFDLRSADAEARNYFEGQDRENWQSLWVDTMKLYKKERYAKESELKARGFTIFTEYQEPKLHPDDPVEP